MDGLIGLWCATSRHLGPTGSMKRSAPRLAPASQDERRARLAPDPPVQRVAPTATLGLVQMWFTIGRPR